MFAVVWLAMAIQPCAMAFGGDGDCPRCPPGSGVHQSHDAGGGDPCDSSGSQCAFDDSNSYDGRAIQIKLKDNTGDPPVIVPPTLVEMPLRGSRSLQPDIADASHQRGDQRSLNILHCIYLI